MAATLKRIKDQHPDDFDYTDAYCAMLVQLGNMNGAIREIKAYLDRKPATARAIRQLLMCNSAGSKPYLKRFFEEAANEEIAELDCESLASTLNMRGAHAAVDALVSAIAKNEVPFEPYYSIWMESLFALGKYGEVVSLGSHTDILDSLLQTPLKGASMAFVYTVSLLKTGNYDKAAEYVARVRPIIEQTMADVPLPLRMAQRTFLTLASKIDKDHVDDKLYWEYFDMLGYSKL